MPFSLEHVVPWGRTFDEYRDMFALTPADLGRRLLGCGDVLYSGQHDLTFHLQAIVDLARVAHEVRIFPLLDLGSTPARHLDPVLDSLPLHGLTGSRVRVPYEFQRGGNEMLQIRRVHSRPAHDADDGERAS